MKYGEFNNTIIYLATYPPRECGIATFSQDLITSIDKQFNPKVRSRVISMNETAMSLYNYPSKVIGTISADGIKDYVAMAEYINAKKEIKLVNIQHEFGIFGGIWGDYLIPFLQVLKKPAITTLHSVLPKPDVFLQDIVRSICDNSKAIIVMNSLSRDILVSKYGISTSKLVVIPHGIPQVTFEPSKISKTILGLQNKTVLSTFGLLSRGKGIEYAIRSLPPLTRKYPDIIYLIIGETHPAVQRDDGERYRNFLQREVNRLGLQKNVKFYNKYLTLEEIIMYLKATDIYISTALDKEQSVSGTLSYALGCGRPVISTSTSYAQFLIEKDRGILVRFRNTNDVTQAIKKLLEDKKLIKDMGQAAYEATRKMIWPNVARAYFDVFQKEADIGKPEKKLPSIKFDYLLRLTDDFGILHHSRYSHPQKRFGYSLDDNARALIVCVKYYNMTHESYLIKLMWKYLQFIKFSQKTNGQFARLVSGNRVRDLRQDDDVLGRAIWALGYFLSANIPDKKTNNIANIILKKSLGHVNNISSPRAMAFAITGLYHYLKRYPDTKIENLIKMLADKQIALYKESSSRDWCWFEDILTYSNSKLPESLYYVYDITKNKKYLNVAEKTLKFLHNVTFERNYYSPIGQAGWFIRNKKRSYYDQQPEDTSSMVETKVVAFMITKNRKYANDAYKAFEWFLGKNHLNMMVYDNATGGCHDGLGQHALNLNQGAEATTSYLLARLIIEEVWNKVKLNK
jgi:glycosyltransferase involved in cell wall biosynthesis